MNIYEYALKALKAEVDLYNSLVGHDNWNYVINGKEFTKDIERIATIMVNNTGDTVDINAIYNKPIEYITFTFEQAKKDEEDG